MSDAIYYYLRDRYDAPRITVCLVKDDLGNIGRGMTICSFSEPIVKAEGRKRAYKRAVKALLSGINQLPIYRYEVLDIFECSCIDFQNLPSEDWKSEYNPELTDYEIFLLNKHKDKKVLKNIDVEVK
jgi:hypothetical protein